MPIQRDRAWLASASPKDVAAANRAGELQTVLEGRDPPPVDVQEELDRIAELHPPAPLPGQGANADSASPDLNGSTWREAERAKLRAMTPEAINAGYAAGDFDELLNIKPERNQ